MLTPASSGKIYSSVSNLYRHKRGTSHDSQVRVTSLGGSNGVLILILVVYIDKHYGHRSFDDLIKFASICGQHATLLCVVF